MKALLILVMLCFGLPGCVGELDGDADLAHDRLLTSGPDYREALEVMAAWESVRGDAIADHCVLTLSAFEFEEVELQQDLPCWKDDHRNIGCMDPNVSVIYLLAGLDERKRQRAIAHEWIHALSLCMDGDNQFHHTSLDLWGPGGVVDLAQPR